MGYRWLLAKQSANAISGNNGVGYSRPFRQILFNRKLRSEEAIAAFLKPQKPQIAVGDMPMVMRAAQRVIRAVVNNERICVYGDYDADGVTSTALLITMLRGLGADCFYVIPRRGKTGNYGFTPNAAEEIMLQGVSLIITADCGIRDITTSKAVAERGVSLIITDHHIPANQLPVAEAIVNPQLIKGAHPQKELSAVGVAHYLGIATLYIAHQMNTPVACKSADWIDLVAIGTLADRVSLLNPLNRHFIRQGIDAMRAGRRLGLKTLAKRLKITLSRLSTTDISFFIAPAINAAGRMGDPVIACELLIAQDEGHAKEFADRVFFMNSGRKEKTASSQRFAEEYIIKTKQSALPVIAAPVEGSRYGISGLIAGRLAEMYQRPAIAYTENSGTVTASIRSGGNVNIVEVLDSCGELFQSHGGHGGAAGFRARQSDLAQIMQTLREKISPLLSRSVNQPSIRVDVPVSFGELSPKLLLEIESLEPTGQSFPVPLFVTRAVEVVAARTVGKEGQHMTFEFIDSEGIALSGILFGIRDRVIPESGLADIVYEIKPHYHRSGPVSARLIVRDIKKHAADRRRLPAAQDGAGSHHRS